MTNYLGIIGSLVASTVALWIAMSGWRRADRRAKQDRNDAAARHRAALLGELLALHFDAAHDGDPTKNDARMKAILLQLPGHLATTLRSKLKLGCDCMPTGSLPQSANQVCGISALPSRQVSMTDSSNQESRKSAWSKAMICSCPFRLAQTPNIIS